MSRAGAARIPKLYALADRDSLRGVPLAKAAAQMADAGIGWIQIRAKGATDAELAGEVDSCCRALEGSGVELWVNDRPDLARLFPVHGVHLGQSDLAPSVARSVLGRDRRIGRSTHNQQQVAEADADEAVDVIAIGPVFETTSKADTEPALGLGGVRRARRATAKPLIAIGGIDETNLIDVLSAGADSVAMVGAVCTGVIEDNCRRLTALAESSEESV